MPHWEGKHVVHWLELVLEIKGCIETMQLTQVEACHLQHSCIGEIVNAEALHAGKLNRRVLLLWWDVKEDAISNLDGTQQAKESHEYDGYRANGRVKCIIINNICVRHGLHGQDKHKKVSHC